MATHGMDPRHLKPDELEYELCLRNLRIDDPMRVDSLSARILAEQGGEVDTPLDVTRLTRLSITKELKDCEAKFVEVANDVNKSVQQADDDMAEQGQSRLVHIAGRITRLHLYAPDHAAVGRLYERVQSLKGDLVLARDSFGSGEQEAIGPPGYLETLEDGRSDPLESRGAIPKTSSTARLNQQTSDPASQRPARFSGPTHKNNPQNWPSGSLNDLFRSAQPPPQLTHTVRSFFEDPAIVDLQPQYTNATANSQPLIPTYRVEPPSYRSPSTYGAQRRNPSVAVGQQQSVHHQQGANSHQVTSMAGGHRIHQWSLRFSGTDEMDVEDFLDQVESQAVLFEVSEAALSLGIWNLLTGKARQWYCTYKREMGEVSWREFKEEFIRRYAPNRESDFDIRWKIESRWQTDKETFNEYCQDVEAMASRMTYRMRPGELLEILKRNMSTSLRRALWRENFNTVADLLRLCAQYERMCQEDERIAARRRHLRINAISYEEHWNQYPNQGVNQASIDGSNHQIAALRPPNENRNEYAECWNCRELGHVFAQCPHPQASVFCFTCGMNGVITVTCPKCAVNIRRGQPAVGAARPAMPNLATMMQRPPPPLATSMLNRFRQPDPGNQTSQQ